MYQAKQNINTTRQFLTIGRFSATPVGREYFRVLFFTTSVSRESGASYALRETIRRVQANGIEPIVVLPACLDSRQMFPEDEFDVVYLEMRRPRKTWNIVAQGKYFLSFPSTLSALRKLIQQKNINLVHFNEITDFIAGIAAKFCGIPCVCHVRHDGIPNPYRYLLLFVLKHTVKIIVVPSNSTAAWIIAERNELESRLRLVHDYAFDANEYRSSVSGADFRRELNIDADAVLVVLVSKLLILKGHLCFIQAAAKVINSSKKKINFVIVGGVVPGHEAEAFKIKSLAHALIPESRLCFVGGRSDLPAIYSAGDIAVHCPIYPDTYPTVVLLPMLLGKPVIGSNIGGIPEQIQDGETGVLVPANEPDALAEAIIDLASDPVKGRILGTAAMSKIKQEMAPETQGRILVELYSEVISGKRYSHSTPAI